MGANRGKQFETIIKEAFESVPGVSIDRLHDQTTGFAGSKNICDFIAYRYPNIFYLELKSCHGNTFPLSNITDNQFNGLLEKAKVEGVIAGVIVWWVDKDVTAFFHIDYLDYLRKVQNAKSIRFDCEDNVFVIPGKKKRVFFDYDMKTFLDEVQMTYDELDAEKIENVCNKVNINSDTIQEIVDAIIQPYCKDLDNYVDFIKSILADGEHPATAQELDDFCMNLSVYIYYASGMQEQLGIKDDIAKALYREMYHTHRDSIEKGTVADKDSLAELASQQEYLTSVCYKRAYSIVKAKVASAQEILSSVKKIISRRMSEMELTRIGGN